MSIIDAEKKAAHRGKCLLVNLDPIGSLSAWLSCLKLSEAGFYMVVLDGVEGLSGLIKHDALDNFSHVHIFSNRTLADKQVTIIKSMLSHTKPQVSVSDVIERLYIPVDGS